MHKHKAKQFDQWYNKQVNTDGTNECREHGSSLQNSGFKCENKVVEPFQYGQTKVGKKKHTQYDQV